MNKTVKMTVDEFMNKYGHNRDKYGDGWEDVVIEQLLAEGVEIAFVRE